METRFIKATELRAVGPRQIAGLAAPYGVRAKLKGFQETIARGAFDRILRSKPDVVCLFNHNADCVLGRTSAGTLRLSTDSRGLNFECNLPNTQAARDLHESIQRRDIAGNSFAFNLDQGDDEWSEDYDEDRSRVVLRTIRNFSQLVDVSPVTHPAYAGTELAARCEHVSAEVRSQLLRRGVVVPVKSDSDRRFAEFLKQLDKNYEDHLAKQAVIARRRNLLNQI